MEALYKSHNRILFIYIAVPAVIILFVFVCAKFFHVLPPFWLIGTLFLLCPVTCVFIRLKLWRNKERAFSSDELTEPAVKIFFYAIPVEIAFSLLGLCFIVFCK